MSNKSLGCLFVLLWIPLALAIPSSSIFKSGCILFSGNKIYCAGGQSGVTNPTYQTSHYILDLTRNYVDLNALSNGWTSAAPLPEANSEFVITASGTNGIFINGGTGLADGKPLLHQSIIYNTITNTWNTAISAANASFTLVQVRGAVGTVDANRLYMADQLYIWGGVFDTSIGSTNASYSDTFLIMNPITGTWNPALTKGTDRLDRTPRVGHAIYHKSNIISIIGGQQAVYDATKNTYTLSPASMTDIPQFDTFYLSWKQANVSGDIPSPRSYHTITPIGVTLALLYGGATPGTNQAVKDYMYDIQIDDGTVLWLQETTPGGPGPRFGHSAVFFRYNTLLLLGGVDTSGTARNDINVYFRIRKAWQKSFSPTELYPVVASSANASAPATWTSCGDCGIDYDDYKGLIYHSEVVMQGIAAGIGAGGLLIFGLIGVWLGLTVARKQKQLALVERDYPMGDGTAAVKVEWVESPALELRPLPPNPGYRA